MACARTMSGMVMTGKSRPHTCIMIEAEAAEAIAVAFERMMIKYFLVSGGSISGQSGGQHEKQVSG